MKLSSKALTICALMGASTAAQAITVPFHSFPYDTRYLTGLEPNVRNVSYTGFITFSDNYVLPQSYIHIPLDGVWNTVEAFQITLSAETLNPTTGLWETGGVTWTKDDFDRFTASIRHDPDGAYRIYEMGGTTNTKPWSNGFFGNATTSLYGPWANTKVTNPRWGSFQGLVANVPEPGTWMTLLVGFGFLGGVLRGYRKRSVSFGAKI